MVVGVAGDDKIEGKKGFKEVAFLGGRLVIVVEGLKR